MTDGAGTISRIRCAACGTEQETPDEARAAACLVCGRPLSSDAPRAPAPSLAVPASGADEVFEVAEADSPEDRTELPEEAPVRRSEEVDELLALERRTTAILALIPVWGAWRIWTSESHGLFERIVLAGLSLAVTAALGIAGFEMLPDEQDRGALAAEEVAADLETLEELLQRYESQYGKWPDEATWEESVRRADPRFRDPWGRAYRYSPPGETGGPSIGTLGRDGARGGDGADRDVSRTLTPR